MGQASEVERRTLPANLLPEEPEEQSEPSYVGVWTTLGRAVFVDAEGELRALRLAESALARGYAWGRAGSGPREVARAILLDATGNEMLAERLCRPFTWEVVSKLPADGFCITRKDVLAWIEGGASPPITRSLR